MMSGFKLLTLIVASWIVTCTLEDSCQDLESIEPCDLSSLLDVEFGRCGIRVTPTRAGSFPSVTFAQAEDDKNYLLVMVDPDAPSFRNPKFRHWRHLVLSDISGASLRYGSPEGTIWTEYNGPSPPAESGPHRYQLFLFEQPDRLTSVETLGNKNRGKWDLRGFVKSNHLCDNLVAGYEFVAENKN